MSWYTAPMSVCLVVFGMTFLIISEYKSKPDIKLFHQLPYFQRSNKSTQDKSNDGNRASLNEIGYKNQFL